LRHRNLGTAKPRSSSSTPFQSSWSMCARPSAPASWSALVRHQRARDP